MRKNRAESTEMSKEEIMGAGKNVYVVEQGKAW